MLRTEPNIGIPAILIPNRYIHVPLLKKSAMDPSSRKGQTEFQSTPGGCNPLAESRRYAGLCSMRLSVRLAYPNRNQEPGVGDDGRSAERVFRRIGVFSFAVIAVFECPVVMPPVVPFGGKGFVIRPMQPVTMFRSKAVRFTPVIGPIELGSLSRHRPMVLNIGRRTAAGIRLIKLFCRFVPFLLRTAFIASGP